jgi:DNA mismatch repair endonuclease MutH
MQEKRYNSKEKLLEKAKECIGIPFKEIEKNPIYSNSKNKGGIGNMIQECWFGRPANSLPEPDFDEIGVELKVTPFFYNKGKRATAKERLVLNIINYMEEYKTSFETSHFWLKNKALLLMHYEYIKNVSKDDFKIISAILFEYPKEDLIIIKQDWEKIIQKIKDGKAHELSEGDTLYLGACRKGAGGEKDLREQPFSDIMANQRAFALKQSYMTYILNNYVLKQEKEESIIDNEKQLEKQGFENYIINKIKPYFGKSQNELIKEFKLNPAMKNVNERIIASILEIKGNIAATEEFKKANIIPKTIRIEYGDKKIKESMSFPTFKFTEIIKENWEDSFMYNLFSSTKFMFIIFKFDENGKLYLNNIKFWNMPVADIEEVYKVWDETVRVIKEGVKITNKNGRDFNNLPGQSFNRVSHIRPHGQNKADVYELPNGRELTKQCFWLNNKYILEQVLKV